MSAEDTDKPAWKCRRTDRRKRRRKTKEEARPEEDQDEEEASLLLPDFKSFLQAPKLQQARIEAARLKAEEEAAAAKAAEETRINAEEDAEQEAELNVWRLLENPRQSPLALVALLLASFHSAIRAYAQQRCDEQIRSIMDVERFVRQLHTRTVEKLRATAGVKARCWYLDSEWLDVQVVREVVEGMVDPFVWYCHSQNKPYGPWDWKGVWLCECEADTVITRTMRAFLSANADEILEATKAVES